MNSKVRGSALPHPDAHTFDTNGMAFNSDGMAFDAAEMAYDADEMTRVGAMNRRDT
jgi:hypothetical protein